MLASNRFKNTRTLAIACLMCLIASKSLAQEEIVLPPSRLLTSFPFTLLTGGIILVRATIDDTNDSLTFVLDTGSGGISFDSTTAENRHFPLIKTDKMIRGIAGTKKLSFANNHCLHFPHLTVDSLDFHINDYELLTSVYGIKIDGVIGYSFFKRFIVRIDYDNQLLSVYTPGMFKYPRGGHLIKPDFSPLPIAEATVSDNRPIPSSFIFDTGAGLCMLMSEDFVNDSTLFKKKRKHYLTQGEGIGGKKLMNLSVIKQIHFGSYRFRQVPVYTFADEFNVTSYPIYSGIIGNDLLKRFNIILNYPEGHIYLRPNRHFLDSFNYSNTGLAIYQVDNKVEVIDIVPNSPGDKAGFQKGDVIYGVDKILMKNIQTIKLALQNAGATVNVIIFRDGDLMELKLKIKNILNG